MPLAFTQEDFLVHTDCGNGNGNSNIFSIKNGLHWTLWKCSHGDLQQGQQLPIGPTRSILSIAITTVSVNEPIKVVTNVKVFLMREQIKCLQFARFFKGKYLMIKNVQFKYGEWRIQDFQGGCQPIIWPICPENCVKMKKFLTGGARSFRPLDPPV